MLSADLLSDTTFRDQAVQAVDRFVDDNGAPLRRTQIYGLRQIAMNQPGKVKGFAFHQRQRAERQYENASKNGQLKLQKEIDFWKLVENLCASSAAHGGWSLEQEAEVQMPTELRLEDNRPKSELTHEERSLRKQTKKKRREWSTVWMNQHLPLFFQRFCAHYLYCSEQAS